MGEEASNIPNPFDVRSIKYLVRLMSHHDLREIDLRDGALRIRLRRGADAPAPVPLAVPISSAAPSTVPAAAPSAGVASDASKSQKTLLEIKSETPGTFYSAPNPGADPFVRAGSKVTPTTVVCVIEAMKIFNEIPAGCTGVITEICVENQQPVEYGQVLFRVDPTA